MRVRLKAGLNDEWLDPSTTYTVLGISVSGGTTRYRIYSSDERTPALFTAASFDVVDPASSARWIVEVLDDGQALEIEPRAWAAHGFWGAYFDGDPNAEENFTREHEALIAESVANGGPY
jgi:hypothetical protein